MLNVAQIILTVIGSIFGIFSLIIYFKYKKNFDQIISVIDSDEFFLSELFFIGFGIMDTFHFDMNNDLSRKRTKEISEIYGKKYAQFHLYVLRGGQITYLMVFVTIAILLSAMAGKTVVALFGIILSMLLVYYLEENLNDKLKARREEIMLDFPNVLSKLTLLITSGMVMRDAWKKVALGGERELYKEMQMTVQDLENGIPEVDAYIGFANRCNVKEIRKFAATLTQNLKKGGSEMTMFLNDMSKEMWETKKMTVKKKGDKAASQLLIPTTIIFVGILILILVPMLASMGI